MGTTVFERDRPSADAVRAMLASSRLAPFWTDDAPGPERPALAGSHRADLVVVGGGYSGLWTAVMAKERDPDLDVVILEARRVGWAASGRNGGFCEASLTHGRENGESRWPEEIDRLDQLGLENLDQIEATVARYGMDVDWQRTGALAVAVEPHQVDWLRDDEGFLDAAGTRALVDSPTYLAGSLSPDDTALVHPAKLARELARVAEELGVRIFERSPVTALEDGPAVRTGDGVVAARKVALATNVFPSLLKRNRLMTVPVFDYSLMTEPLTAAQLGAIGWEGRQGVADLGNQFHYYRLTADDRLLFGGYDAIYHAGGRLKAAYQDRSESYERLASHLLTTFPQLEGIEATHRWAGAIDTSTRFCAFFGSARGGDVAYSVGFTGLGVGATRFGANVMLDLLTGEDTERTRLRMVRERPLPFPPEPLASIGINATRWSLDRADHHEGRRNLLLRTLDRLGLGFDS
ncbi:FAD-dependent oxidoreductase [Demequina sp. SYSU T00039]|uniref:FAD-dependent oxidoreductase n=1 Tax=Demequina lignilytica TaxID=3051663 RepID=A0AAW7MA95_9MICO|nr:MULTISPECIES: FAD-dependent oxidoreductase [unclassified Demequina]MDN4478921.1 FAD-dependent oxidoreductase [Demequina sp. SYSU T00039-1]MDN4488796.1 FAD-dependent oxidoreductase [Demequina sp. SYSU T00039]